MNNIFLWVFLGFFAFTSCKQVSSQELAAVSGVRSSPDQICMTIEGNTECGSMAFNEASGKNSKVEKSQFCTADFYNRVLKYMRKKIERSCEQSQGCVSGTTLAWAGVDANGEGQGERFTAGFDVSFGHLTGNSLSGSVSFLKPEKIRDTDNYRSILVSNTVIHSLSAIVMERCQGKVPADLKALIQDDFETRYCSQNAQSWCSEQGEGGEKLCSVQMSPNRGKSDKFELAPKGFYEEERSNIGASINLTIGNRAPSSGLSSKAASDNLSEAVRDYYIKAEYKRRNSRDMSSPRSMRCQTFQQIFNWK